MQQVATQPDIPPMAKVSSVFAKLFGGGDVTLVTGGGELWVLLGGMIGLSLPELPAATGAASPDEEFSKTYEPS